MEGSTQGRVHQGRDREAGGWTRASRFVGVVPSFAWFSRGSSPSPPRPPSRNPFFSSAGSLADVHALGLSRDHLCIQASDVDGRAELQGWTVMDEKMQMSSYMGERADAGELTDVRANPSHTEWSRVSPDPTRPTPDARMRLRRTCADGSGVRPAVAGVSVESMRASVSDAVVASSCRDGGHAGKRWVARARVRRRSIRFIYGRSSVRPGSWAPSIIAAHAGSQRMPD
ncbi:hypothetical protein C8Q80DRAFT_873245 [Daedaleopsis nitida]|nr:hypothetical protein C8Q80DRAFT_873245 [Daedaleopsis nitida]